MKTHSFSLDLKYYFIVFSGKWSPCDSNHAPCKFVLTQYKYIASDFCYNFTFILRTTMLQYMLNYIISILILFEEQQK